jgi:hypothetical protein
MNTASMNAAGEEERDGASIDSVHVNLDREHDGDPTQSSSRPELTEEAPMTKLMLHNNNNNNNNNTTRNHYQIQHQDQNQICTGASTPKALMTV